MSANVAGATPGAGGLVALMTRERWIEVARIVVTSLIALLFWQGLVPVEVLWVAIAIGLYPLVKKGLLDLFHEHKVGTEIFVTVATLVAVFGGETVPAAVAAVASTDRSRAAGRSRTPRPADSSTRRRSASRQDSGLRFATQGRP